MKIGVYLGSGAPNPKAGGGFTFQESIFDALLQYHGEHTFFIYYHDYCSVRSANARIVYKPLSKYSSTKNIIQKAWNKLSRTIENYQILRQHKTLLNHAVQEDGIELMWFMTPAYEYVEIPYLYTVWDLQHRRQSFFPEVSVTGSSFDQREQFYQRVIPKATYVIVGNQVAQEEVVRFYNMPHERVKTLEFPTPNFAFSQQHISIDVASKYGIKKPYLFYPAQFWPHKNHVVLLEAIKLLQEQANCQYDLVFTGSDKGNLSYVQQLVRKYGLEKRVFFLGFVAIEDLVALYQNAFSLVFPSYFGPNNIPPLEAMALGCPVIAANAAGMQDQLGDAALFFDPQDASDLVQPIMKLEKDNVLRKALIEKGKLRAKSWKGDDYIKGIIGIINTFASIRKCWSSKEKYVHF